MSAHPPRVSAIYLAAVIALPVAAGAETLKASHQFPGGKGDVRDEMVQIIAREVAKAGVDLDIRVYPGASLFKPKDQWNAMVKGQLDITAFPLDYANGQHPQFSATLMPGLVRNHEHAKRLNDSPFMQDIKKIIEDAGVIVLADAWLAGAFGAKTKCIRTPEDVKGIKIRSAGPAFEEMWAGAGASIASMPSNEVYTALQTGVVDATDTSSGSFVSFRLQEQLKCLTAPGDYALWFMYEPVLMSKRSFDKLKPEQQKALMDAGQKAEDYFFEAAKGLDKELVDEFQKAGVQVISLDQSQFDAWRKIAEQSSYKSFSEKVPGGDQLIKKALAVQ